MVNKIRNKLKEKENFLSGEFWKGLVYDCYLLSKNNRVIEFLISRFYGHKLDKYR